MAKKMYVIQAEDGMFFCGMRYWDKQLRKAKIYHSLAYAEDVSKAYEECNCKIVEVSLEIVPEAKTNADRIRSMSDEQLAETLVRYDGVYDVYRTDGEGAHYDWDAAVNEELEWLKQPAE